ncbi:RHS repeat domain-containing protein [Lysobacter sp. FW306-1B-D06B]|uniref:RHS repeat domain-containing protein n=1 Tax=Lysobacter sp. FW306-1B-D06B TaxID=3140250 RepID=UPI0031401A28
MNATQKAALILLAGTAATSIPADAWACSVDVIAFGSPLSYLYQAECPSRDAANAGCAAIEAAHGYPPIHCGWTEQSEGNQLYGYSWGGWFWDQKDVKVNDLTTYQYYASNHPECSTSPTTCAWRQGDLWKITNAAGQVVETLRYDGAGRALSTKDSNGVITDFAYDPRGRLTGRTTRAAN